MTRFFQTDMKKIGFLCPISGDSLAALQRSNLASIRLRTALAWSAMEARGSFCRLSDGQTDDQTDLIIVSKIDCVRDEHRSIRWLKHLTNLKNSGSRIMIDYTDHHLCTQSPSATFYRAALPLADVVICSSSQLATFLAAEVSSPIRVIEDPIEVEIMEPKVQASENITAIWFGHASNLPYLVEYLHSDFRAVGRFRLILMTNSYPLPPQYVQRLNAVHLKDLEIIVLPWTSDDMKLVAGLADFCLIPAGVGDPRKQGASSNRLLTALALGLPVAADPLPSYVAFQKYFIPLRPDGFESLAHDSKIWHTRVIQAQNFIAKNYTFHSIGPKWTHLIESFFEYSLVPTH